MYDQIGNLKFRLRNLENEDADKRLINEVRWINNKDERIENLSEIISLTSASDHVLRNQNYRSLVIWNDLYDENEEDFVQEFQTAIKEKLNGRDTTKAYKRFSRFKEVFSYLPAGSYVSCTIPNSYWYRINNEKFRALIDTVFKSSDESSIN